jgi:hypothetical protein
MEALQRIQETLKPGNQMPIQKFGELSPRVEQNQAKNDALTSEPHPRVQFDTAVNTPYQLVVVWPQKQIVQVSPKKPTTKPKLILRKPKYIADSESVADQVKARCAAPQAPPDDHLSVAKRVANRRRAQQPPQIKAVHAVLDEETGELLEYHQLLKHPCFKDVWNWSSADPPTICRAFNISFCHFVVTFKAQDAGARR